MEELSGFETAIVIDIKKYKVIMIIAISLAIISLVFLILTFIFIDYWSIIILFVLITSLVLLPITIYVGRNSRNVVESKLEVSLTKFINENYEECFLTNLGLLI